MKIVLGFDFLKEVFLIEESLGRYAESMCESRGSWRFCWQWSSLDPQEKCKIIGQIHLSWPD